MSGKRLPERETPVRQDPGLERVNAFRRADGVEPARGSVDYTTEEISDLEVYFESWKDQLDDQFSHDGQI